MGVVWRRTTTPDDDSPQKKDEIIIIGGYCYMQITINNYGGNITINSVCLKCLNMIKAGDC